VDIVGDSTGSGVVRMDPRSLFSGQMSYKASKPGSVCPVS